MFGNLNNNETGKAAIAKEMEKRLKVIGIPAQYKKKFWHFLLK